MSSVGVKVSQKGYDVTTAADYQLLFSSAWPLLKIERQETVVITDIASDQVLYNHNLGYPPVFWVFEQYSSTSGITGNNPQTLPMTPGKFFVNETELVYQGYGGSSLGSRTVRFFIFRLPIDVAYTAPIINEDPTAQTIVDNYGIKVAKDGKDVSSTDMRDFVVHSSTKTPMVHKVLPQAIDTYLNPDPYWGVAGYIKDYPYELSYRPMYNLFVKGYSFVRPNHWSGADLDSSGAMSLEFTSSGLRAHTVASGVSLSVVMFKDQLLL